MQAGHCELVAVGRLLGLVAVSWSLWVGCCAVGWSLVAVCLLRCGLVAGRCELVAVSWLRWVSRCGLVAVGWSLWIDRCGLVAVGWSLWVGRCGLVDVWVGRCGLVVKLLWVSQLPRVGRCWLIILQKFC